MIHHLLCAYTSHFLTDLVDFLPGLLQRAVAANQTERTGAVMALSGFALALVSTESSAGNDNLKDRVGVKVCEFVASQLATKPNQTDHRAAALRQRLVRAITEDATQDEHGPRWAVTLLCCLIVLSGPAVFTSGSTSCRLVVRMAEKLGQEKKRTKRDLLACIFKSLIWAFAQIPPDDTLTTAGEGFDRSPATELRESAFGIVSQEPRGHTGLCLIAALQCVRSHRPRRTLHDPPDPELVWIVAALRKMVEYTADRSVCDHIYQEGVSVLARLVSAIGSSTDISTAPPKPWSPDQLVVRALFDRHVLSSNVATFTSVVHQANSFDLTTIRPLEEEDIQKVWRELLEIWKMCVSRELAGREFATLQVCPSRSSYYTSTDARRCDRTNFCTRGKPCSWSTRI